MLDQILCAVITFSADLDQRINQAEAKLANIETSHLPGLKKLVRKNQDEVSKTNGKGHCFGGGHSEHNQPSI